MKNQKGFSLIELLVVVVIIAIIAAIAIPNLLASRRAANQSSTVANLRTLVTGEVTYAATTGAGSYGTLLLVSGADLIDDSWAGATTVKNGYTFTLATNATNTGFCITAVRQSASTGDNSYAASHQGVIYELPGAAAPACDSTTGVISTGTVVGD